MHRFAPLLCLLLLLGIGVPAGAQDEADYPAVFSMSAAPNPVHPGELIEVTINVDIERGHHMYSAARSSDIGATTVITYTPANWHPEGDITEPAPHILALGAKTNYELSGHVVFKQQLRVPAAAAPGNVTLSATVTHQICDEGSCLMPRDTVVSFPVTVAAGDVRDAYAKIPDNAYPVTFSMTVAPEDAHPGELLKVTVTADVKPTHHIYSALRHSDTALGTSIQFTPADWKPEGKLTESKPHAHVDSTGTNYELSGKVEFVQYLRLPANLEPNLYDIVATAHHMACSANGCLTPQDAEVTFNLAVDAGPVRPEYAAPPKPAATTTPPEPKNQATEAPKTDVEAALDQGLWAFLLAALSAGFVAMMTPCTFPMIPVTIAYFTKQSHHSKGRQVSLAATYYLGIVGMFTLFGLMVSAIFRATGGTFGGTDIATNGWVNLAIGGLFILFALSLFGMFDIKLPDSWIVAFSSKGRQGGYAGVFFMALVFTMVSFTCTAPFIGSLIGIAARGAWFWPALGMFAFAAAMGFPFFFLGMFPTMMSALPGSGGWLHRVKIVLAFVELIAAYKFLWAADVYWNRTCHYFTRDIVLASWVALFAMTGLYLIGVMRVKDDEESERPGGLSILSALLFFVISLYLAAGLFRNQRMGSYVEAYLPPLEAAAVAANGAQESPEPRWLGTNAEAVAAAKAQHKPIFYYFTGIPCNNCLQMEAGVLSDPEVAKLINAEFIPARMYFYGHPVSKELQDENFELMKHYFGGSDKAAPQVAIVTPDGEVLKRFSYTLDVDLVLGHLHEVLDAWKARR